MGRKARSRKRQGIYHIYNRSSNKMRIFNSDELKQHFLDLIERYNAKYHLKIYHYAIMTNHFHLAIEGDIQEISAFVSGLSSRYTIHYHKFYDNGHGSIWQGRYKSILVQKEH